MEMIQIKERVGKLLEYLEELVYPQSVPIEDYRMLKSEERFTDIGGLNTSGWQEFHKGQLWGGHREYYWFETIAEIPESFDGKCVVYELKTGREGEWDATNPQFRAYVDGKLVQGLDVNHREIILTEHAEKGRKYRIILAAFTGDQNFSLRMDSCLKVLDRKTEKYYYDLRVPYEVARLLPPEDSAHIEIIKALNDSLNLLDLRQEDSAEYERTLEEAQNCITENFYKKRCGGVTDATVYCVGHTHIDCAWLWTLSVTRDKAVRSFSTVLELMKQYPEYVFMSSQPQLYEYVKQDAPDVFEEIRKRVREGRWEVEGGMWLEADCNLSSGESFIRQFLHGQRFFEQEFGKRNEILWLPDVFGYSAALPQIMKKCGVKYFMTTKISWNEFNKLPYDTFLWEGIDGTEVLTHFICTRDYHKGAVEGGTETDHFTDYNGYINPSQIKGTWERYSNKDLNNEVLCSFGFGDGGGGPTRDMLENQRRLSQGIPGCPTTKMSTAGEFFHLLEKNVTGSKWLPKWVGELYLEYHRGTYTSMARNKKYNRQSEFLYEDAELFSEMAGRLANSEYPKKQLYDAWEVILRNQFHDILPGSAILEVYEESREEYEKIGQSGRALIGDKQQEVVKGISAEKGSVIVFNPNTNVSENVVTAEGIGEEESIYDRGKVLPTQRLSDGKTIFEAKAVPGKGYKTFRVGQKAVPADSSMLSVSTGAMENRFFRIAFNEKGQFSSIFDKRAGRELLKDHQCGNVIMSYEDRPHNFENWDLNVYYTEKSWAVDDVSAFEVTESGPVRACVKIERKYLSSSVTQYIYMYADYPRIDIKNEIDWKEHQIFLKMLLPVDIHTDEATFDIQYGNVKRYTHANTSWDFAKFEVCMHKWLDVSEDGYGVSVLNDCKFGCSVRDGVIGLSMLKSGVYPNPEADKEHHEFTYSIVPHEGGWREADIVGSAYSLNNQMTALVKDSDPGELPKEYAYVSCDQPGVVIEAIKKAEDSNDTILRLYECYNRRTPCVLTFADKISAISECSMLEEPMETEQPVILADGRQVSFRILPYEIKTFKVTYAEK
jgi:alpha-mannosidase